VESANKAMAEFVKVYGKNTMIHFVSISIDPTVDQPAVLANYAKVLSAKPDKWDLLTGDSIGVKNLIKKGLLLDALKTNVNGVAKLDYSNMFVLVDLDRKIRGYYEVTNQEALSKLDDEIKVLIAEELRNMRDGR
ncbi:MAG: SCO family protein, partial [Flavobacterium sp.]